MKGFGKRILFVLSSLYILNSCTPTQNTTWDDTRQSYKIEDWFGTYKGTMYMYYSNRPDTPVLVDLMLEIAPTADSNRWIWRTSFDSQAFGKMVKDYTLVQPDTLPKGAYWLDEGGGVLIHTSYFDDTFYSHFSIGGQYIQSMHKLHKNKMLYEIILQPQRVTYGHSFAYNNDTFHLESYRTTSVQRAVLTKTK